MRYLKDRPFIIPIAMTGLVRFSAMAWIHLGARAEVERLLDRLNDGQCIDAVPVINLVRPRRNLTCHAYAIPASPSPAPIV